MTKRVLIDLSKLKDLNSGLGQVNLNFALQILNNIDTQLEYVFLLPDNTRYLFSSSIEYELLSLKRRYLPRLCPEYSLWHATYQGGNYRPHPNTPYILTIHDLNYWHQKKQHKANKFHRVLQQQINHARALTFISNFTYLDVKKYFDIPRHISCSVIENGVATYNITSSKPPASFTSTLQKLSHSKKFLFTIGIIYEKKNFLVLVDLLAKLPPDYCLIIAGNNNTTYAQQIQQKIVELKLADRIKLIGVVTEEEKHHYYKNCYAFVFPSKWEGFGLPVIEAMRYGKPVFLSTLTSLPEIGDKHAYYWDNFSPAHMHKVFLAGMEDYTTNNRKEAIIKYANQEKFTWQNNAQQYIQLYKQILGITA